MTPVLSQVATRLNAARSQLAELRGVTGFDGFVDEMTSVVAGRQSLTEHQQGHVLMERADCEFTGTHRLFESIE